jgi:hypothetical protein
VAAAPVHSIPVEIASTGLQSGLPVVDLPVSYESIALQAPGGTASTAPVDLYQQAQQVQMAQPAAAIQTEPAASAVSPVASAAAKVPTAMAAPAPGLVATAVPIMPMEIPVAAPAAIAEPTQAPVQRPAQILPQIPVQVSAQVPTQVSTTMPALLQAPIPVAMPATVADPAPMPAAVAPAAAKPLAPSDAATAAQLKAYKLEIANGNGVTGLAKRVGRALARQGLPWARLTNARPYQQAQTVIQYRPTFEQEAQSLGNRLPKAPRLVLDDHLRGNADLRLVLGKDINHRQLACLDEDEADQGFILAANEGARQNPRRK